MKKQVKENPMFKDQKQVKKIKSTKAIGKTEDENEIKSFIIIIIVIVAVVGIVYAVNEFLVKKDESTEDEKITEGVISYDKVFVGTMLNRPYDEYYVMVYNSESPEAVLYSTIMSKYSQKEKSLKIYFCDLDNELNSKYYDVNRDGKSNPSAKSIKEFNFGDITLIKVKKGKVVNYIEGYDQIKETLE